MKVYTNILTMVQKTYYAEHAIRLGDKVVFQYGAGTIQISKDEYKTIKQENSHHFIKGGNQEDVIKYFAKNDEIHNVFRSFVLNEPESDIIHDMMLVSGLYDYLREIFDELKNSNQDELASEISFKIYGE